MQKILFTTLLALTASAFVAGQICAAEGSFTPAQQDAIGKIAADYLRTHPELLVE